MTAHSRNCCARTFLFLQGYTNPFFARLGDALRNAGHEVFRINFCTGDMAYWFGRPAWRFGESVDQLPRFLEQKFEAHGFTDVLMLGDTRPVNRLAIPVARRFKARVHVLEEGYFRPNWITLEEGGVNGYSRLPKDPCWYRRAAKLIPTYDGAETVASPIWLLAMHELGYHLPNLLNPLFFPGYRTHRPHISPIELYGWARRFSRLPFYRRLDQSKLDELFAKKESYYLFPLQVSSDSQIQQHSSFIGIPSIVKRVIRSFVRNAPQGSHLVIKNHPLDTGFFPYKQWISSLQRRLNISGRILYCETGHLPTLLHHAKGVVTVNSSVGTSALAHGCPTIALGRAIYDLPGLTYQGTLDQFWNQSDKPDNRLFHDFRNVVVHCTQVNGGYWDKAGIEIGVQGCVERLSQPDSRLDALLNKAPI